MPVISPKIQDFTGFVSCHGAVLLECLSEGEGITMWHPEITLEFVVMAWLTEATRDREYLFDAPGDKNGRIAKRIAIEAASAPVSSFHQPIPLLFHPLNVYMGLLIRSRLIGIG
eukprot:jgi/Botrbrau1/12845/Bobra.0045s0014.1